jgi:steroid delta-isomerase-like uncharacterized protein
MTPAIIPELYAKREAVVDAHIRAEAIDHDVASTLATFRHPRYEVPALEAIADGPDAVTGLVGAVLEAFPDFHLRKTAVHHSEDAVIVECVFGGTQKGVWAGIPPTGKAMQVQGVLIFVFDEEHLVCEKVFFDHATILSQLGKLSFPQA